MSMPSTQRDYDVVVIGGGHAGCEAALAASRLGQHTCMITLDSLAIGRMSCNPSIGGLAKSQLAREVDALGGEMGRNTDATSIQFRLLNTKKGAAVQAFRVQSDKYAYQNRMQRIVAEQELLDVHQGMVVALVIKNDVLCAVVTGAGEEISCRAVIVTTGTFLNGYIHRGLSGYQGGRDGELAATGLTESLLGLGFRVGRLKTGTPARIHRRSINFSVMEEQPSDQPIRHFSFDPPQESLPHVSCYITYSNPAVHETVRRYLSQSPLYTGMIKGVGPRYCPSFEDKVVRFPDKERHQIFLEPEGLTTDEFYVNGLSTSLPAEAQLLMLHGIPGLEHAEVIRYGYAVEYDFLYPNQLKPSLETRKLKGLFLAGQVNGTSGYEEAAAQGLMAGINASLRLQNKQEFILNRNQAYIGVLVDDLITKNTEEPYRMFTSQAEQRLYLRNDNADLRLTEAGYRLGLVTESRYRRYVEKKEQIAQEQAYWHERMRKDGRSVGWLKGGAAVVEDYPQERHAVPRDVKEYVLTEFKYEGYIDKQKKEADRARRFEDMSIPDDFPFENVLGLKKEAREKLSVVRPTTLGQAARIMGVTPADVAILLVHIEKYRRVHNEEMQK